MPPLHLRIVRAELSFGNIDGRRGNQFASETFAFDAGLKPNATVFADIRLEAYERLAVVDVPFPRFKPQQSRLNHSAHLDSAADVRLTRLPIRDLTHPVVYVILSKRRSR